jgi:hypothetical protein
MVNAMTTIRIAICCALVAASTAALAEDKKVTESDVPKVVLDKVHAKYKAWKLTAFEQKTKEGKAAFEVKIVDGDKQLAVTCYADGSVRSEADKVAIDAVPAKVRAAWHADPKYGKWTVHHAEHVIRFEKTADPHWKIKATSGARMVKLEYDAAGKLIASEEKDWHPKDNSAKPK